MSLEKMVFKGITILCVAHTLTACGSGGGNEQSRGELSSSASVVASVASSSINASNDGSISSITSSSSSIQSNSSLVQTSSTESSDASSSTQSALHEVVFIYPTQKAHLGGIDQIAVKLKVSNTSDQEVAGVSLNGVELTQQSQYWVTTQPITLEKRDGLTFDVDLLFNNGETLAGEPLKLNNVGNGVVSTAGDARVTGVKSLAFDIDDATLYATSPESSAVFSINTAGSIKTVYQGEDADFFSNEVRWPIAVDSGTNTVYFIEDYFRIGSEVKSDSHQLVLHQLNPESGESLQFCDSNADNTSRRIDSALAITLDLEKQFAGTKVGGMRRPTVFSLDAELENGFQRWILDVDIAENECNSGTLALIISPKNTEGRLLPSHSLESFAYDTANNVFYVAKVFSEENGRGNPEIIRVFQEDDGLDGFNILSEKWLDLKGFANKPTALAMSNDNKLLYVADSFKIWSVDIATQSVELVSSSSGIPEQKGAGVNLTATMNSIAMHPTQNILYVATDVQGIVAIDLETGNRIAVLK